MRRKWEKAASASSGVVVGDGAEGGAAGTWVSEEPATQHVSEAQWLQPFAQQDTAAAVAGAEKPRDGTSAAQLRANPIQRANAILPRRAAMPLGLSVASTVLSLTESGIKGWRGKPILAEPG